MDAIIELHSSFVILLCQRSQQTNNLKKLKMNLKIILSWTVVLFFVVNNVLGQIGIGGPYGGYFFDPNDPIVQTNFGPVRGEKFQPGQSFQNNRPYANGLSYVQFIGIPYGAPPVGENRFRVSFCSSDKFFNHYPFCFGAIKPPHFPPIWTNTLDCTGRKRIMCPQVYQRFPNIAGIREDEDCLHLNIYIPVVCIESDNQSKLIIGFFQSG